MTDAIARRVVVVTGGSSGIGRSTARLFARRGWRVGLVARSEDGLQAAQRDLAAGGATVAVAAADVTDSDALRRAALALAGKLGPIDAWINNAGIGVFARFVDMPEAEFRRVTEVNYLGVVNGTRVALEHMRPRDAGAIVNICSAIGLRGVPLQSAYSGAKYAMRGFAEALRAELAHERSPVHLTTVYPPSVNTPFYNHAVSHARGAPRPPPPVYQPEVVADAIYFAATHRRRDVLVGGQTVQVRLLNVLAPGLAERLLALFGPMTQTSSKRAVAEARDENVFNPMQQAAGEHGAFDSESLSSSVQLWATKNRMAVAMGLATTAIALALFSRRR